MKTFGLNPPHASQESVFKEYASGKTNELICGRTSENDHVGILYLINASGTSQPLYYPLHHFSL